MIIKNTFEALDNALKRWSQVDTQKEVEYYALKEQTQDIKSILYTMYAIDAKSSALLTHISIMFVVLGILISSGNPWIVTLLLSLELIIYIIVASLLLRCLDIMGFPFKQPPLDANQRKDFYYVEIALRRAIYAYSLRVVYVLTLLLIPIILFKYML